MYQQHGISSQEHDQEAANRGDESKADNKNVSLNTVG